MTNFERSHLFNNYRLLGIFPDQITFTQKVRSGNIKFIQNLSPFGIADFAESVLRCKAWVKGKRMFPPLRSRPTTGGQSLPINLIW